MIKANNDYRNKLKSQLIDANGRVVYTYTCHHKMIDHIIWIDKVVRITQISLTAISTCGFLSTILANNINYSWIGGATAALSLALNLYSKEFSTQNNAKQHKEAADILWDVRENYVSLITDFDILSDSEIRAKREKLQEQVSNINKNYPSTDKRSYKKAQKALKEDEEQTFNEGEAEAFLSNNLTSKTDCNYEDVQDVDK